jgi:hypothetical protein
MIREVKKIPEPTKWGSGIKIRVLLAFNLVEL